MLGHDGPPGQFWMENLITGEPLQRCPVRALQLAAHDRPALAAEVERYTETYYPAYEDGHLLGAGGIADQPARYLELIGLVRGVRRRAQAKWDELTKANQDE
ncbi:MAG TPA: hypothetical protein VHB25_08585 [Gemmatimonadaceae bacterium]|nr:hypothetical protein [Gemmatimonadaceae bacterium]